MTTLDPRAEVVAVIPYIGGGGSTWPMGRIVWKADDDVWWTDVTYQNVVNGSPGRVSSTSTGDGPFPTHQTEVSVSRNLIMWTHNGSVMAIRP